MAVLYFLAAYAAVVAAATSTTAMMEPESESMSTTNIREPGYNMSEPGYNMSEPGYNMSYNMSETTTIGASTSTASTNTASTNTASTSSAAMTTTQQTQTIVHKITLTSLEAFTDAAALQAQYKASMSSASGVSSSGVQVQISKVVVKVTVQLTGVTEAQLAQVKQGIATHAGVDVSAVELVIASSRRLLEQSQESEDERRLSTNSTNWVASITVTSSMGDVVTKAKDINTAVGNATAVAAAIQSSTGGNVTATVAVSFEVTMSAVLSTGATLDTAALDTAIGSSLNGTAETTQHTGGTGSSPSPSPTTTEQGLRATDDSPLSSGYILVAFMSVLLGVRTI